MSKKVLYLFFISMFLVFSCSCNSTITKSTTSLMTVITAPPEPPRAPDDAFYFEMDGVIIVPGAEYPAAFLPMEDASYAIPSTDGEKNDKVYCFTGVEITTYTDEYMTEYVESIYLMDDSVHTPELVSIGDPVERAITVYGDHKDNSYDTIHYKKGKTDLEIIAVDGIITSIEFRLVRD